MNWISVDDITLSPASVKSFDAVAINNRFFCLVCSQEHDLLEDAIDCCFGISVWITRTYSDKIRV